MGAPRKPRNEWSPDYRRRMERAEARGINIESKQGRAVARGKYNEPAARGAERISHRNTREREDRSWRAKIENIATAIAGDVAENDRGEPGVSYGAVEVNENGEAEYVVTTVGADGTVIGVYRVPVERRDELLTDLDALGVPRPLGKDYADKKHPDRNPDETEEEPGDNYWTRGGE